MLGPMFDVEGFILVGGASSRMGTDKSRLDFAGQTSVERIAESLKPLVDKITLVGAALSGPDSLPAISDVHDKWGPLGGIHAALQVSRAPLCMIVACDLPFVTSALLDRLIDFMDDVDAVVPMQSDGHPQPLCAVYRVDRCLVAAREAIARKEHSPRALLDQVNTRYVEFEAMSRLPGSEHFFFNVNTPENLQRAREILTARQDGNPDH